MHRVVSYVQVFLSTAISGTCCQLALPFLPSFFTVWIQSVLGRHGLLLRLGGIHSTAAFAAEFWQILMKWPVHRNLLSLIMFSILSCKVNCLISHKISFPVMCRIFVTISCELLLVFLVIDKASAQWNSTDKIRDSYNLVITVTESHLLAHILPNLSKTELAFPKRWFLLFPRFLNTLF